MATLDVGMIVILVEQIWDLSVHVIPFLFPGFFVLYLLQRDVDTFTSLAISSQRDMALHYSIHILLGIALGGVVQLLTGRLWISAVVASLPVVYGVIQEELPEPTVVHPDTAMDYMHYVWVIVPLLAVTAIAANHLLLQSIVALIFYATIFWEL